MHQPSEAPIKSLVKDKIKTEYQLMAIARSEDSVF
jgi:hypothetical protein